MHVDRSKARLTLNVDETKQWHDDSGAVFRTDIRNAASIEAYHKNMPCEIWDIYGYVLDTMPADRLTTSLRKRS